MTSQCASKAGSAPVVGRPGYPQSSRPVARAVVMLMLVIAVALTGVIATPSYADEAAPSPTAAATTPSAEDVSANIVDTQNLLGDNLGAVTDAIKETYERTGVTVRLIYVNSFNTDKQPDAWAAQTLKSLDPPPNTVLLAVASNDGNLAVVVSPDSAEWLRNRKTVDKLSEAASAPLTDDADANGPNWAKSAIDMMQAIQTAKSTSTSSTAASVGIIVMIGAVAVLLIGAVVVIVVRRRRETERDAERVVEDGEAQDDDARKGTAETAQASDADPASGGASAVADEH
ncbi:TPM domain-containing protein [Bifidobacterium pseudolongum]|uniref:TPM domain-containing protein n=1 Tax=Bifidobacterium pseudolongum TaxID=1694 RepID=UPI00101F2658|nr:TPM domain-containing protein [Bifidobacterium pseudolongum]MCI1194183.1 TPM domain-containing protein [Bifidobacterium pseudolongum subsp. globosum]UNP93640.1 TPM domain-containing protein [Bifidobacterium pseudolongum subsp. globosum]UNZ10247.1 TPM domain-containing protein [Bifidobacterium pseudolongum subsp. globosum]